MKPHKHAEFIKAWADGHTIQYLHNDGEHEPWWVDITGNCVPWDHLEIFRVKPAEKVVRWLWVYRSPMTDDLRVSAYYTEDEAFQCWHGETFYKKLEWSREEFDE